MPPSTIVHLDNIVAVLRRSPATVEHQDRHHAVVLTELSLDTRLDRSSRDVRAERVQELGGVVLSVLDRSGREDVRLHRPRCSNASAFGLRGYVDTLSPLVDMYHHDLACAYDFFLKFLRSPTTSTFVISDFLIKLLWPNRHDGCWFIRTLCVRSW